jgi:hypothetical protein
VAGSGTTCFPPPPVSGGHQLGTILQLLPAVAADEQSNIPTTVTNANVMFRIEAPLRVPRAIKFFFAIIPANA